MGRNKRNIVLENIELTDAGSLGKSISKKEGEKIIFTKNGVPGDIVDIRAVSYTHLTLPTMFEV